MNNSFNYNLTIANLGDLSQMRVIEKACFPLDAWPLLEQIAVLIFPNLVKIKAEVDQKMVGFVCGDPKRGENKGWITTLGVLPHYQQRGIATALLDQCEIEMGLPYVRLSVRKSNISAQRLYFNRGYYQVEIWEKYYDGGEDGLVLEKKL